MFFMRERVVIAAIFLCTFLVLTPSVSIALQPESGISYIFNQAFVTRISNAKASHLTGLKNADEDLLAIVGRRAAQRRYAHRFDP